VGEAIAMVQMNRPLGLGELLDGAFRLYRASFARLVLTAAIFLVPVGVLSTLLLGATVGDFTQLLLQAGGEPVNGEFDAGLGAAGAYIAIGLLGNLAMALAYAALTAQVAGLLQGEELTTGASVRRGVRRLLPLIGLALAVGLAVAALALALYIALFFVFFVSALVVGGLGALSENSGIGAVAVALTVILAFVYIAAIFAVMLPVGLLLARWLAAPTLVVVEHLGPLASLSRSWRLTRNNLWRIFGYMILLAIFNAIVLGLPSALLQWVLIFAMTSQWYGWLSGLLVGVSYLFNVLWLPFITLAMVMLYFDLRVRNESLDLEDRVRRLEESTRPTAEPS
jgi:hypothetical protein